MILWVHIRTSRTNTPKRCPFRYRGLESKSRKSRDTWSNKQICPWNTEWSKAKANGVFPRECTGHSKHPLFQQHMRRLYTWTSPDCLFRNQIDYILCNQRWRSSIYTVSKTKTRNWLWFRSWLLISKFRLKLKKAGKPTKPFRYDLNQIPYNYRVEWQIDSRDFIWQSAWRTMDQDSWHCTRGSDKDHSQEEMQKGKMVVWGGLHGK